MAPPTISIHALLAESDSHTGSSWAAWFPFLSTLSLRRATRPSSKTARRFPYFYPRSPCGERLWACTSRSIVMRFLSTLSLRRATAGGAANGGTCCDFYPRSPCGERRCQCTAPATMSDFYPRSPCGERLGCYIIFAQSITFLSTLSLRRATA